MHHSQTINIQTLARITGGSILLTIIIGMLAAFTVNHGIDINLTADIAATTDAMMEAETRLHAKAYIGLVILGLQLITCFGLYLLLRPSAPLLSGWSLSMGIIAALTTLLGAIYAMNAAQIAGNSAFDTLADSDQRLLVTSLQVTGDYTSFHLGLILSCLSNAGFFIVFLRSGSIPKPLAAFGVFASLFVAVTIVARDFLPVMGHNNITAAFMLCNLVALVATGLYLTLKGVRTPSEA